MVDYESYFQYGDAISRNGNLEAEKLDPGCACSDCLDNKELRTKYRMHFDSPSPEKSWEDEQYLICPPRVLGYILREKQWAQLQVSFIHNIANSNDRDTSLSRLKLADEFKEARGRRGKLPNTHCLLRFRKVTRLRNNSLAHIPPRSFFLTL